MLLSNPEEPNNSQPLEESNMYPAMSRIEDIQVILAKISSQVTQIQAQVTEIKNSPLQEIKEMFPHLRETICQNSLSALDNLLSLNRPLFTASTFSKGDTEGENKASETFFFLSNTYKNWKCASFSQGN